MDAYVKRSKRKENDADDEDDAKKQIKNSSDAELKSTCANGNCQSEETTTVTDWRQITGENLNCSYCLLYSRAEADELLRTCEASIEYNTGDLAKVQIFGKWHDIPRKQVAYGDTGLSYHFSGNTVPARPWPSFVEKIRDKISRLTGHTFNFVLVNRYKDGNDHMGEHRDDEKELVVGAPIASLSLGQERDFVFKHGDSRGKKATRKLAPVTLQLAHGSLLMMNHPTNTYWYHALPVRKKLPGVRINMTFRHFKIPSANKGS